MVTKFYIVKPEYTRPSEEVAFTVTGVEFRRNHNNVPSAFNTYADARAVSAYLYKECGWVAPLVVGATANTATERRAIVAEKALGCYGGKLTIREAGKA